MQLGEIHFCTSSRKTNEIATCNYQECPWINRAGWVGMGKQHGMLLEANWSSKQLTLVVSRGVIIPGLPPNRRQKFRHFSYFFQIIQTFYCISW